MQAVATASPVPGGACSLGGYYTTPVGGNIGSSNGVPMQVPNGCIGTNGYINNNNCLMNGTELSGGGGGVVGGAGCNMSSNMSSYTNGQHVVGPFKTYSK